MNYFKSTGLYGFLLILLLSGFTSRTYGQSWAWAYGAGGVGDDAGHNIAMDGSGNIYVVGYFSAPTITFGSVTLTNAGVSDVFLVKYDASGSVLWAKSVDGTGLDRSYALTTDASGNVYIAGYFESTSLTLGSTILSNPSGTQDMFIAKYDAAGTLLWAVNTGVGTNEVSPSGIAVDPLGNVYVTGIFGGPSLTLGSTVLTNGGGFPTNDMFVAKYNSSGAFAWAKSAGGTDFEDAASVACDASGNVYVAGNFRSSSITFGTTTLMNSGSGTEEIFLTKYDGSGNVIWATRAGGTSDEQPQCIRLNSMGDIYMSGIFYGGSVTLGTTTLTGGGSGDIFLAKYDASGAITWATGTGGSGAESAASVNVDAADNVYMTGYYFSTSLTFGSITLTNPPSSANMYLVKYNSAGSLDWAVSGDGGGGVGGIGVVADATGNVYVTGTFGSATAVFGTTTLTNTSPSSSNVFVAKYFVPVPTGSAPFFTGGSTQSINTCKDVAATINTVLTANDADAGQTETWSVIMPAVHGTAVAAYTAVSTGSAIMPTGLTYTPASGYTGSDSFSVMVSDGALSDTILIHVTVSLPPDAGILTGADSVCQGDTIHLANSIAEPGVWGTSNPSVASVYIGGIVMGLAPGTSVIRFVTMNSCGFDTATHMVVVKSFADCSAGVTNVKAKQVSVYPNPSQGLVTVDLPEGNRKELTIFDALGKAVITKVVNDKSQQSITLDLKGIAPGNYAIRVVTNGEVYRDVLVIQ